MATFSGSRVDTFKASQSSTTRLFLALCFIITVLSNQNGVSARPSGDSPQVPVAVEAEADWKENLADATESPSIIDDDIELKDDNNDLLFPRRQTFSGIATYAHLPLEACLHNEDKQLYDIAVVGIPYDIAVSYRPGARFGPNGIRQGSRRIQAGNAYDTLWGMNPFQQGVKVVDCADLPVSPYSTEVAFGQMERGYRSLLTRHPATPSLHTIPKVVVLGGDHAITLPVLRALKQAYGKPITVIHFDSHIDSWKPAATAHPTEQWYHGSMFYWAWKEGLTTTRNVHVGIRTKLWGNDANDYREDESYGWSILEWNEIWKNGTDAAIKKIRERVGEEGPIYLSLDIDVVNPGEAPATGTPEPGGLQVREVQDIIRGLRGLPIVAADLVEVSPAYDGPGEITQLTAAYLVFDFIALLVDQIKKGHTWEDRVVGEEHLRKFKRRRDARVGRRPAGSDK